VHIVDTRIGQAYFAMAKGDAAQELGRWLEVLHRAAAAAALESWWSFCTRHPLIEFAERMKL